MPVTASIDTGRHIITMRFSGETSFLEWKIVMDGVLANPEYVSGMCVLSDRTSAASTPSSQDVRELVRYIALHAENFSGCGVAIVSSTAAEFGMSRMAEILAERTGVDVRAFKLEEEAVLWLASRQHLV